MNRSINVQKNKPTNKQQAGFSLSAVKIPWFILLFIIAMCVNTFVPQLQSISTELARFAKKGMTLALFFVGAGFQPKALVEVGTKPLALGVVLWLMISVMSLLWII